MSKRFSNRAARRPNHVRAWRKRAGLTIEQLAEMIEASPATVSRIENAGQEFNEGHQQAIARALGCSPWDLLYVNPDSGQQGDFDRYQEAFAILTEESKRQIIDLMRILPKATESGDGRK